jgi:site-specific DNA recombinase
MDTVIEGYVRVSRVGGREGEGFISPDVQERAIREWAARNGREIVVAPHELNVSGGTMDRPVFNEIMGRIRAGKSGGIVVYKLDRFARTLTGALNALAELNEHDAVFASATEQGFDWSTPAGRAFMQQMLVFAEFMRSTAKESWHDAQQHATERGVHIAPADFLGYDKGSDGRLVPNADAPVVAEVFRRRGAGETWGALADFLNVAAPREPGRQWTGQAVQRLCDKRVYRGEASRYVVQNRDGREPVVNRDAHTALVTEPEWQAAQMDPRIARGGRRDGEPLPLLSGLVRCAGCRRGMSLGNAPCGDAKLYRCRKRHASGTCGDSAQILADVIEEHVQDAVLTQIAERTQLVADSGERDAAVAALAQARADYDEFRLDTEAKRVLGADWLDTLDAYKRAAADAASKLALIDARDGLASVEGMTREHFLALPVDDRREVLGGFIDAVIVRRSRGRGRHVDPVSERVRILWRGEAPADLPRQRVAAPIVPFVFDEPDVEAGMVAAQHAA